MSVASVSLILLATRYVTFKTRLPTLATITIVSALLGFGFPPFAEILYVKITYEEINLKLVVPTVMVVVRKIDTLLFKV